MAYACDVPRDVHTELRFSRLTRRAPRRPGSISCAVAEAPNPLQELFCHDSAANQAPAATRRDDA